MRDWVKRSLARGSLLALALVATGVFAGTALSSSGTRSSEQSTSAATILPARAQAAARELRTLPQIRQFLREQGVDPASVVVQRGARNYAGPDCPGAAWNCTTSTRVVQISTSASAASANTFVCRLDAGGGTATPDATAPEQSCVIVQPGGSSNSATCDMNTTAAAGLLSQTCLIAQGGTSNSATAKLFATLGGPGTEQDVLQRVEILQTGGAGGNTAYVTENATLFLSVGRGSPAIATKQDYHQVACVNQQAAGAGENLANVTQKGAATVRFRNRGDVSAGQNTEALGSTCLESGPAAPFADISGTGHDPIACPVAGESSGLPKTDANVCARVQQVSATGANKLVQTQESRLDVDASRVGGVNAAQGSENGGVDSTLDQSSAAPSTISATQSSEQLVNVASASGVVNMTQVEDPRCCAAGHQLGNTASTWKLRQSLRQRAFVDKVLVTPETFRDGTIVQRGAAFGNCDTDGTPPAGCTVEQEVTNNDGTETNTCGPAASCDSFVSCDVSEGCATDKDLVLSNTATVSSSTPDPNSANNSDTETTSVQGSSPDAAFSRRAHGLAAAAADTPNQQPPPNTVAQTGSIIDNGSLVQLGIHDEGHLNVCCGSPSFQSGTTTVGLRYLPTDGEATAPGCTCEGWGIANADEATGTFSGYANDSVDGVVNLTVDPATGLYGTNSSVDPDSVGTNFRAVTTSSDRIKVTQDYHPSSSPNLYEVLVTMENIGDTAIGDVRYRRVMDWDVPPTTFSEWSEIHVGNSSALVRATSDGFLSANPLDMSDPSVGVPPTTLHSGDPDYFSGPADQGASFDFQFGTLAPGQTKTFRIFYGAAADRPGALAAIAAVGGEVYSLGMPTTDAGGPAVEGPNVFVFAFAGVGGQPIGNISLSPLAAENEVGQDHTVTATLDDDGTPIEGKLVTFSVVSGPNEGLTGTDTSDANGEATFTYTSELTGTDVLEAKFVDDNENTHTSNRVEKTWIPAAPKSADLSVDKTDSQDPVSSGGTLTYTLLVSNAGPDSALDVVLTDVLPPEVSFVSATPSQGSCSGTTTVTCNLGTIASGGSATVTIVVTVP